MDTRRTTNLMTLFSAKAATGVSSEVDISDSKYMTISLSTASSANMTVKIRATIDEDVDLSSARSVSNSWDYVSIVNSQTGSAVAGDTGISFTGTDATELIQINCDLLKKVAVEITARSAGSLTATAIKAVQ